MLKVNSVQLIRAATNQTATNMPLKWVEWKKAKNVALVFGE